MTIDTDALPDGVDPADAFALLGNETRIAILRALWAAESRPVSFTELRRAVGVDDSAQFNYHLGELRGRFVRKVDDGYEFRYAGEKVVRAIIAGTFTDDPRLCFRVDGSCGACGGDLVAQYEDERLGISCLDCPTHLGRYPFPPGGLRGRDHDEILAAFNQRVRHLHCLAADGVCPECSGRMDTRVTDDEEDRLGLNVRVDHRCRQCRHVISSPVTIGLLDTAAVVAFHDDHGVDLPAVPYWTLDWCVYPEHTTVTSRDPWRLVVDIPLDDETLRVTLDGDLAVVDTEREGSPPAGDRRGVV